VEDISRSSRPWTGNWISTRELLRHEERTVSRSNNCSPRAFMLKKVENKI
jgi:hypothetical protein